jgi:hypothetical protein
MRTFNARMVSSAMSLETVRNVPSAPANLSGLSNLASTPCAFIKRETGAVPMPRFHADFARKMCGFRLAFALLSLRTFKKPG